MPMATEYERELRRQLEEPLNQECRPYPLPETGMLVTMLDTPYYTPSIADSPHYHNCTEIGLCVGGNGFVLLGGKRYPFSEGALIVAPRGVYHNQEYVSDQMIYWRYLVVNDDYLLHSLPQRYASEIHALFEAIAENGLFIDGSSTTGADAIIQLMFDMRRQDGRESSPELELSLLLLLQIIARHMGETPLLTAGLPVDSHQRQPIEPALAYVYEHYKEDIAISALARSCSMSESYFRKQFLKVMGMSPLEHVNRYRIHRATNLLRTTTDSIQNIAVRCGFSSIAAFNRNFRQFTGMSAGDWRRSRMHK